MLLAGTRQLIFANAAPKHFLGIKNQKDWKRGLRAVRIESWRRAISKYFREHFNPPQADMHLNTLNTFLIFVEPKAGHMKRIVIFASGSGTNAEAIASHFAHSSLACVSLILSNRKDAFVLERARNLQISSICFSRTDFYETGFVLNRLTAENPDLIVLAGFLWLLPEPIVQHFPKRIINIHPALLPKYGGKGMYGAKVHEAVLAAGEKESGITIHYVNEKYDEGDIIFQARCPVLPDDTPQTLAQRIHTLEHKHYPEVIEKLLASQ